MQLATPDFEESVPDYCRQNSPVESIISNDYDSHGQRNLANETMCMNHSCAENATRRGDRKERWPSSASDIGPSLPVLTPNRNTADSSYGSERTQQRPYSEINEDSTSQMLSPCFGKHGVHGNCVREFTTPNPQDTSRPIRSAPRVSPCSNKDTDLSLFLPFTAEKEQHNHRTSQLTEESRESSRGKVFGVTTGILSNKVLSAKSSPFRITRKQ